MCLPPHLKLGEASTAPFREFDIYIYIYPLFLMNVKSNRKDEMGGEQE